MNIESYIKRMNYYCENNKIKTMKSIKTMLGVALMGIMSFNLSAQDLPQPSPAASFIQRVGVTDISMQYSRPSVKGRKIWGELVPYNKIWRAGANSSTKIEFSTDVMINNKEVKAGKYALYVIPTEKEWTFIISSYVDGWGVGDYTEATDAVRVTAIPSESAMTESLLYTVDKITENDCQITLSWEKVSASFDVQINTVTYAGEVVEKLVKEADNSFRSYNDAAKWYMNNDASTKAVEMAEKSVAMNKKFWNLTVLSEAYAANGDTKMAMKTAKEALEMSEKADYKPYIDRNKENISKWGGK